MNDHSRKKMNPVRKSKLKSKSQTISAARIRGSKSTASLFERIEIFLTKHMHRIFWITFALTTIFGILLFDIRFSLAGDDSAYVVRAYDFIHHFIFPGFQGPLYPIVLSPFVAIFGLAAIPLKCISLLFILGFFYFFYKSLKGRVPALLLSSMLILLSINSFILYYGSQTYSEALFMFVQVLTISVFYIFFIEKEEIKPLWVMGKHHLLLACCLLCLGITRFIGFSAVIAVVAYFLQKKQWKNLLFFTPSFLIILIVYQAFKNLFFAHSTIPINDVLQGLISKDYYNPTLGHETFIGFINRFVDNSNYYLSTSLYTILGLRNSNESGEVYPVLTAITYLTIISAIILVFRKNSYLFFLGLYTIITLFIIFFIAHTIWLQSRFIIPYFSMILLLILSSFYYLLSMKRWIKFQLLLPVIIVILFGFSLKVTADQSSETRKIDNKYYGLTPDWENYCRLSEWTTANLPANTIVACRKPSISFIFSKGKNFFGITRLPFSPGDSFLHDWQRKNLHYYLIPASTLNNKPVSEKLSNEFKNGIVGYGMNIKNKFYQARFFVLNFPETSRVATLRELNSFKINVTDKPDSLEAWLKDPNTEISMIYPDSALKILMRAHVTHVLTDNIRSFASQKNEQSVTTVERFMNFIEAKYPGIRTKIKQIGSDDNEPASLYRINYNRAGLQVHQ